MDLPNPGIKPGSPALQVDSLPAELPGKPEVYITYAGAAQVEQCKRFRDVSSILGLGRSPGVGNGNAFQYSYLKNSMDRDAWWPTFHGVTKG